MNKLEDLIIWKKSIELSVEVYKYTEGFPKQEQYGLTSQIRRAAVSIPSNISEGAGRDSNSQFSHFLNISNGSPNELKTQIIIAERLNYISTPNKPYLIERITEIQRIINSFKSKLSNHKASEPIEDY